MKNTAILLIDCPDRKGIVAAIANFLYLHGANILHADQHQDNELQLFFMRVEWDLEDFDLEPSRFAGEFQPLAESFQMRWRLEYASAPPRWRCSFPASSTACSICCTGTRSASCPAIPLIVSNHPDARPLAEFYGVPFHHIPVTADTKDEAERQQLALIEASGVDLVVLARYMQILSPEFVARYPQRIINVHHSFLPAFSGAKPYHAAFQRGVKLIGATSHYVTSVLDEGPIIEQDVTRVSHRDELEDLVEKGRDLERIVLSRAVRWHLEHRILCYGNKTVVFD